MATARLLRVFCVMSAPITGTDGRYKRCMCTAGRPALHAQLHCKAPCDADVIRLLSARLGDAALLESRSAPVSCVHILLMEVASLSVRSES